MAALMRSVRAAWALTPRYSVLRRPYHSKSTVLNYTRHTFLPNESSIVRVIHVPTRQSSSSRQEVAILEKKEGQLRRPFIKSTSFHLATEPQALPELVKQLHVRKSERGFITPPVLIRIMELLRKGGAEAINTSDSALVLQCTGRLLMFTPKKDRADLLQRILEQYKDLGIVLKTQHYNAILQSYSDNGVDFNPIEFLGKMEVEGASPNERTYEFLIAKFCRDGNVGAASEILQHMKQASIPVGEEIFASFITGYMKNDNTEKAKQILEVMSANDVEPTGLSYATFLWSYAEKGDIEGIRETISNARANRIQIEDADMHSTVMTLAEASHHQCIPELLEILVQQGTYMDIQLSIRNIRELIASGHENSAVQIYQALKLNNVNTVLIPLIRMNSPFTTFMDVVNKFKSQFTPKSMEELVRFVKDYRKDPARSLEILHFLQKKGFAVDNAAVKGLLRSLNPKESADPLFKAAVMLIKNHTNDLPRLVYDLSLVSWHLLERLDVEEVHAKLDSLVQAENELSTISTSAIVFLGYLNSGQFQAAVKYGEENAANIRESPAIETDSRLVRDAMLCGYRRSGYKLDVMLDAIKQSSPFLPIGEYQISSDVLQGFINMKQTKPEDIEQYLKMTQEKELKILPHYKRRLLKGLGLKQVPEQVVDMLDTAFCADEHIPDVTEMQKMETAKLEKLLPKVREIGILRHIRNVSRILIRRYCAAERNEENAVKIRNLDQLMETNKCTYDFLTLKDLMLFYTKHRKDLQMSLKLYDDAVARFRDYEGTTNLVLLVATLQAENGQVDEAFKTVQDHLDCVPAVHTVTKSKILAGDCVALLNAMDNEENVSKMYKLLIKGFVAEDTYNVMKGLIMAHMRVGATAAVIQDIEKFSNEHKIDLGHELSGNVLSFLIKQKEEEHLKKVTEIISASKGPVFAQHILVKELISEGNIEEAKNVLEKFQPSPNMALVNRICNSFLREGKPQTMKQFLEITKDIEGLDREQMIFWLLKIYVKLENGSEALNTFMMFHEENIVPQPRTLRTVGRLLNSLNVTALPPQLLDPTSLQTAARPALEKTDVAQSSTMAESQSTEVQQDSKTDMPTFETSNNALLQPEEKPVPEKKDVAQNSTRLESLSTEVPQDSKTDSHTIETSNTEEQEGKVRSLPAQSNQVNQLIVNLKADPDLLKKYCARENLRVVAKHCPELVTEFEAIILSQPNPSFETVQNVVGHYLDTGRTAEAKSLIENILMLKCEAGDWKGGLEYYQGSLKSGLVLSENVLTALETLLIINNQPVPW